MVMKLYVGNLSFNSTEDELHELFSAHGQVNSAKIVTDRETGRSRGFAFVEMASREEGTAAIDALNGATVSGRALTVNEARPMERSGGRSGGGGGGGRGFGGGGDRGFGGGGGGDRGGWGGGGDRGGDRGGRGGRGGDRW